MNLKSLTSLGLLLTVNSHDNYIEKLLDPVRKKCRQQEKPNCFAPSKLHHIIDPLQCIFSLLIQPNEIDKQPIEVFFMNNEKIFLTKNNQLFYQNKNGDKHEIDVEVQGGKAQQDYLAEFMKHLQLIDQFTNDKDTTLPHNFINYLLEKCELKFRIGDRFSLVTHEESFDGDDLGPMVAITENGLSLRYYPFENTYSQNLEEGTWPFNTCNSGKMIELSPAEVLTHELGHAYNMLSNSDAYLKRSKNHFSTSKNIHWNNEEEKFNIKGLESEFRKWLKGPNIPIRNKH